LFICAFLFLPSCPTVRPSTLHPHTFSTVSLSAALYRHATQHSVTVSTTVPPHNTAQCNLQHHCTATQHSTV
jgi:hypothetical protein